MSKTLVVVADSYRARFYAWEGKGHPMVKLADLIHAESRLRANELISDRQGRTFDSHGSTRHAKEIRTPLKVQQAHKFARMISAYIETEKKKNNFGEVALVAAPAFLGILRKSLENETGTLISHQIDKDLVLMRENVIREHLAA